MRSFLLRLCASSALFACAPALCSAQTPPPDVPDEVFEKVDPYTKGQRELLDRAGYASLGPFQFAPGIETLDVEETLGNARVLWVETAHFKLGSTLPTYECSFDDRELARLKEELGRLAKKLPRVRRDASKIDPWLRLHLYAQRLEELYADFETRFGLSNKDFPALHDSVSSGTLGSGPYLGQDQKFVVLLTAKDAPLARFAKRWIGIEPSGYYLGRLTEGAWCFATSAQTMLTVGAPLDSALHALVAYGVVANLYDGFRGGIALRPTWFRHGLALVVSRKIEERWSVHVQRVDTGTEKDSGRWEPRLFGLVTNKYVASWEDMLGWDASLALDAAQHMTAWSRVAWLLSLEKIDLRGFLLALTEPIDASEAAERTSQSRAQQVKALSTCFEKTPAALDEAWRKFVLRKYQKR